MQQTSLIPWCRVILEKLTVAPLTMVSFLKEFFKYIFDVRKSVHHHTIQINEPTRCNSFTRLLFDVYVWLNMFRTPPRPSSGAYNCTSRLWFYFSGSWFRASAMTTMNKNQPDAH
jgi:hypothetical protein